MSLTKEDLETALTVLKDELRSEMRGIEDKVDTVLETARQIETNLLTEFHRYAKNQQIRLHSLETCGADLTMRLAVIEERLLALEFKPQFKPRGVPPSPTTPPQ